MPHEYYTEFNATLEAHGFEKLAEETIDALSKEAAYYDAFISTCLQQGMTKSAAVTLYKEGGLGTEVLKVVPQIFKNLSNIGKVRSTGKGVWTAIRHPFITDKAIKGSDAAIAAAKTTGGRTNAFLQGIKAKGTLSDSEKILNDIVATRGKNIAATGSRAAKNQNLLDSMILKRIENTPTMGEYYKSLGMTPGATRVGKLPPVGSKASMPNATASTASKATAGSTAAEGAVPKATTGSTAAEGAAAKATEATTQGTSELKNLAANSTTDAAALGTTGTKDTAALTAGIKDKLKAWGPYAFVGGAGYFLGNHGSGSAPITVAPTIMVPGAGAQGGAYIPGAQQNGLMYGYG